MPSKIQTNTAKAVCVPSAGYGGQVKGACQGAWACLFSMVCPRALSLASEQLKTYFSIL